ncbi:MAG: RlmE family RNA methyltransferase [Burkholderiales bacterium]|jgi:23S rRNA (uridine2552-2'-O)-methyltransferase|nr:RlmE family RNA methyltransferase [Burkholderiales bacterium]
MPTAKKKHRSNPEWIRRHVTDPYVKAATQHGYRARSAYKLIEIDDKDRLLKPGQVVVDLGAVPGSWTQVVRERLTGKDGVLRGRIVALDVLPLDPLPEVTFIQGDFREEEVGAQLAAALSGARVDVVLSDMAPNLSGIGVADAARSSHLCELALEFAQGHLKPNGVLLIKAFQGSGFSQLVEQLKKAFVSVATRKPAASRAESAETYLLARGLKARP